MSNHPIKRRGSVLFDLALTFGAGAFVFVAFAEVLKVVAP